MTATGPLTILSLPPELVEAILSQISHPRDLLQLACTCSSFRELVIPRHLEYRVLKLPNFASSIGTSDYIWRHLAQCPNLTRNMYEVHVITHERRFRLKDRVRPKTLLGPEVDRTPMDTLEKRDDVIISALRLMTNLNGLLWDWKHQNPSTKLLEFLLNTTSVISTMSGMTLVSDPPATSLPSPDRLVINSHRASHIQHLRLKGTYWATPALVDPIVDWLHTLTSIRSLTISSSLLSQSNTLTFPSLRNLKLFSNDSSPTFLNFLARHNGITTFDWLSTGVVNVPPEILPNVTKIRCDIEFFKAIDEADIQDGKPLPRPIRCLVLGDPYVQMDELGICAYTCLDHSKLRCLKLNLQTTTQLQHVAHSFPKIRQLQLSGVLSDFKLEEVYPILQLFTNLEVLLWRAMWDTLPPLNFQDELGECIRNLAGILPRLRQVNYPHVDNRQIMIIRGESVTYRVENREYSIWRNT